MGRFSVDFRLDDRVEARKAVKKDLDETRGIFQADHDQHAVRRKTCTFRWLAFQSSCTKDSWRTLYKASYTNCPSSSCRLHSHTGRDKAHPRTVRGVEGMLVRGFSKDDLRFESIEGFQSPVLASATRGTTRPSSCSMESTWSIVIADPEKLHHKTRAMCSGIPATARSVDDEAARRLDNPLPVQNLSWRGVKIGKRQYLTSAIDLLYLSAVETFVGNHIVE